MTTWIKQIKTSIDERILNVLYSILLFWGLCGLIYLIPWDSDFAGAGIFFATEVIGLIVGLLFVVVRLFNSISKTNFFYTYFSILNLILGVLSCIGFIRGNPFRFIGLLILTHFLIGIFILIDIFSLKNPHRDQ